MPPPPGVTGLSGTVWAAGGPVPAERHRPMPSGRPAAQRHGGYVWFPADVDNMTPEKLVGLPRLARSTRARPGSWSGAKRRRATATGTSAARGCPVDLDERLPSPMPIRSLRQEASSEGIRCLRGRPPGRMRLRWRHRSGPEHGHNPESGSTARPTSAKHTVCHRAVRLSTVLIGSGPTWPRLRTSTGTAR